MKAKSDNSPHLPYYTTAEAAEKLGISLRTAQLWVESNVLEAWKTEGGHRRISFASVERLLSGTHMGGAVAVAAPEAEHPLKVLVVEDDFALLRLYKLKIESWKLPITLYTAGNGYEALIQLGKFSPDLLITDLSMPNIDGFQVINTLLHSAFREGLEVVVVTGIDEAEIRQRGGIPEGVRKVLPKPVPFQQLEAIAKDMLMRRAQCAA